MPVSVTMPRLGESVSEGTVTRWLKKEGEHVDADEPLLEVSTDKVDTEIPAPASGVLTAIRVGEDETVEVGVELAVIDQAGAPAEAAPPEAPEAPAEEQPAPEAAEPATATPEPEPAAPVEPVAPAEPEPVVARETAPSAPAPDAQAAEATETAEERRAAEEEEIAGAYVTPLVRKLAAEHSVDLSAVQGTGVGGRIRKQDVLEAARLREAAAAGTAAEPPAAPAPAPAAFAADLRGRTEKMSRLRTVIAERMLGSLRDSAQLTTVVEVDVTRIARLRDRAKADFEAREGVKLSFLPFFAIAAVEALKQHAKVNGSIDTAAGTITYHDAEHLGVAVDTERGLLVPVIHDAGDLNLGGMARKIADLAERTRANRVSPDELGGGTFTLTNTGSRGALFDTPIINQPQAAILGTGAVVRRPVVVDDPELGEFVAIRSMVYLALTYDHRLVDGADAARFLTTIKDRLQAGAFEGDLGLT